MMKDIKKARSSMADISPPQSLIVLHCKYTAFFDKCKGKEKKK